MNRIPATTFLAVAVLSACSAAPPTHFYSLVPAPAAAPTAAADFRVDLQEVEVPAQVDIPQMVVRTGAQELVPVETRRWIAPLGQELRAALSADLSSRLGAQDVHGLSAGSVPVYGVDVVVRRFDSALGAYARIDAGWTLTLPGGGAVLSCASSATESVAPGYAALAAGHQRALARIADAIAAAVKAARNSAALPACPAS